METIVEFTARPGAVVPEYKTPGAAGCDICACLDTCVVLAPGERRLIPTGISVAIPAGFEIQVRPRSGLALKSGIGIVNSPGTIDSDYRGEIGVLLINHGAEPFTVSNGDRIAQLVLARVERASFRSVDGLDQTTRGAGGYGSTGVR